MGLYDSNQDFITIGQFIKNFKKEFKREITIFDMQPLFQNGYIDFYIYFEYKNNQLTITKENKEINETYEIIAGHLGIKTKINNIHSYYGKLSNKIVQALKENGILTRNKSEPFFISDKSIHFSGLVNTFESRMMNSDCKIGLIDNFGFSGFFKVDFMNKNKEIVGLSYSIINETFEKNKFCYPIFSFVNESASLYLKTKICNKKIINPLKIF